MGFNIKNMMNVLGAITNPKQAISMMLNKLPQQQAQMLQSMMNSGKNPRDAIIESARSGQINLEQLNQAKSMYQMARKFGYHKFSVPQEVWNEAESLIKEGGSNNTIPQSNRYTRF